MLKSQSNACGGTIHCGADDHFGDAYARGQEIEYHLINSKPPDKVARSQRRENKYYVPLPIKSVAIFLVIRFCLVNLAFEILNLVISQQNSRILTREDGPRSFEGFKGNFRLNKFKKLCCLFSSFSIFAWFQVQLGIHLHFL